MTQMGTGTMIGSPHAPEFRDITDPTRAFVTQWCAASSRFFQYAWSTFTKSSLSAAIQEMKVDGDLGLLAKLRACTRVHFLRVRVKPTTNLQTSRSL